MSRIYMANGHFIPAKDARVAMEDRGYQFADGIYEVVSLYDGVLIDETPHLNRLERSLFEMKIPMPMSRRALQLRIRELIRLNRKRSGLIYMQVTRGVAPRGHVFGSGMQPVLTMAFMPARFATDMEKQKGVAVILTPDLRWARCDIKSIALLPNVLSRMEAHHAKAKEAWQVNAQGVITEGSLSNAYIVNDHSEVITHPSGPAILGGVRREILLELAKLNDITITERAFTPDEARSATEAFMTSASTFVLPITTLDGAPVGNGKPGPITQKLMALYDQHIATQERVI